MTAVSIPDLPFVPFSELETLPSGPGIYFALAPDGEVLYIGRSVNIAQRWVGHHRAGQLGEMGCTTLAWLTISETELLPEIERGMIAHFMPSLNDSPPAPHGGRLRELLAQHLARLIRESGKSKAQLARELGYSRQRLYQLETANRSALPEAIEEAINKLGYEIDGLNVKRKEKE